MKYAAKKIVWMLLTMVIVSFLAFLAFRIIPGDPTAKLLGEQATPERVEALRQELGLDRPFLERYVSWLGDFVRGDMGSSYNYSMPVSQMLQGKIPVTGLLTLLSFLLIVVLSIPLGLFTARHSGGALDKALTVVNQVLMAVPDPSSLEITLICPSLSSPSTFCFVSAACLLHPVLPVIRSAPVIRSNSSPFPFFFLIIYCFILFISICGAHARFPSPPRRSAIPRTAPGSIANRAPAPPMAF